MNKLAQEKNKYYPQIVRILNNEELSKIKFDSWIFVISGTPTRNISINEEELIENLSIVSFYLPNLEEFIYEMAIENLNIYPYLDPSSENENTTMIIYSCLIYFKKK